MTCANDGTVFARDLLCVGSTTASVPTCTETGTGPMTASRPITYYVNSVSGDDSRDGRTPATAWKTMDKVNSWNWGRTPFKAGDSILLSGTFTTEMYLALEASYGSASQPITITSLDPQNRATLSPSNGDHGIVLYDSAAKPAKGLGVRITDLNFVGVDGLDAEGESPTCRG